MRTACVGLALLAGFTLAAPSLCALQCPGDCDGNGVVTISELINGVNIAIGASAVERCAACDRNGDGAVTVDELIAAVRSALEGCPATPSPTATPPASPTATATPSATVPPTATRTATVLACDRDGVICTVAGTGNAQFDGDGRDALDTSLYFPIQVLFDRDGQPLINDWNNLRLRRINTDGTVATVMGTGIEALPSEGALAIDTPLHHPSDFTFDASGRMFVAGDHVSVVFRVDTDQRVHTVAGNCPTEPDDCYGYSGDHGPALEARLSTPVGVLPDAQGGFYVSDVDTDTVRYVDAQGIITTVAGSGRCSTTAAQICTADGDCPNGESCAFEGYGGDGGPGTNARLADPRRMTFGPDGAVYFAESKNHVVRRLDRDGTIGTFAGTGTRGYGGDGGPAHAAMLDSPYDIVFVANGDAYVADTNNNVIRRIDATGQISTVAGTGSAAFGGDGGPLAQAALRRPSGIVFDDAGSMWIADTSNQRVRRVWHYLK